VAYSRLRGVRACIGGNTLFAGFPERLEKELKALLPDKYQQCLKIKAEPERRLQYGLSWPPDSFVGLVNALWASSVFSDQDTCQSLAAHTSGSGLERRSWAA
jgi:actin-related protein